MDKYLILVFAAIAIINAIARALKEKQRRGRKPKEGAPAVKRPPVLDDFLRTFIPDERELPAPTAHRPHKAKRETPPRPVAAAKREPPQQVQPAHAKTPPPLYKTTVQSLTPVEAVKQPEEPEFQIEWDVDAAWRGFVMAEILAPPLAKRGRGPRRKAFF
jgi:hypothetical protein